MVLWWRHLLVVLVRLVRLVRIDRLRLVVRFSGLRVAESDELAEPAK